MVIQDSGADLNVYTEGSSAACCGPEPAAGDEAFHDKMSELLRTVDANEYAASVKIFALKP